MDQPPLLKTRRSNAVHSRRLAVHVSLLERHLAALEAGRARAVRALQDELNHLHVLRRPPPPLSPRRREAVLVGGSVERNSHDKTRRSLPPLERFAATENQALVLLHPPQKWPPSDTHKGLLPPITAVRDSPSNDDGSFTKQSCEDASKLHDSSSLRLDTCSRPDLAGSRRSIAGRKDEAGSESEQHTAAHDRGSGSSSDASDPVGVPFQARVSPRESRSLPPLSHDNLPSQGHHHRQRASSKKEGGVLKGNLSGVQSNRTIEIPGSSEGLDESKSALDPAETETEHQDNAPSGEPEPRPKIRMIQNEAKESPLPSGVKESRFSSEVNAQPTSTERQPADKQNRTKRSARRPGSRSVDIAIGHHRHSPGRGPTKCHLALSRSDRCGHFPCTRPPTYHSLGFHPDRSAHPWPLWLLQNARRPHHRLRGAPGPSSRDTPCGEVRQAADDDPTDLVRRRRRLGKEEVVRLDMARKKRLHALHRPPSWNTNYGRPTPYKRLNCPARLKPLL